MDSATLGGAVFGLIAALVVTYGLRKQKRTIMLGVGGSLLLSAIILFTATFDIISGIVLWILGGLAVVLFVLFSYLALKPESIQNPPSS